MSEHEHKWAEPAEGEIRSILHRWMHPAPIRGDISGVTARRCCKCGMVQVKAAMADVSDMDPECVARFGPHARGGHAQCTCPPLGSEKFQWMTIQGGEK